MATSISIEEVGRCGYAPIDPSIYRINFHGHEIIMTVTSYPNAISSSFVQRGIRSLLVGLDAEWYPDPRPNSRVATLHTVQNHRLIFQIISAGWILDCLQHFLSRLGHKFYEVGIQADVKKLQNNYNFTVRNVHIASLARLEGEGLQKIAKSVLGLEMHKSLFLRASGWNDLILSKDQIQYVAIDAYVSLLLGQRLDT